MTIDERASDVARLITRRIIAEGRLFATNLGEFDAAQDAIAAAIREAVAEEREACAVICERVYAENRRMGLTQRPCSDEAAAIRVQHLFE